MARKPIFGLSDLLPDEPPKTPVSRKAKSTEPTARPAKDDGVDYLSQPFTLFPCHPTPLKTIPNSFPTILQPYRIAIIGAHPTRNEELDGAPFAAVTGATLNQLLGKADILRQAVFTGYLSQLVPMEEALTDPDDLAQGMDQLAKDLAEFKPNVCLLLGKLPLQTAKPSASLDSWRGSFFISQEPGPFYGRKCLASYAPADCHRVFEWMPLLMFDIKKVKTEAFNPVFNKPERYLITTLSCDEICQHLRAIRRERIKISIDIEGYVDAMTCISVAIGKSHSFIIPFVTQYGESHWSFEDEITIMTELSLTLFDPDVPKILQNALYDRFVLQYSYALIVRSNLEDTMLKHWELFCELEKSLGFLCSLYTNEPFYKSDRKSDDQTTFWEYCCRDSAVTYEISNVLTPMLPAESQRHYSLNINLLNALLYMELKGISYDTQKAHERLTQVQDFIYDLQSKLDSLSGCGLPHFSNRHELEALVRTACCFKRDPSTPKKDWVETFPRILEIVRAVSESQTLTPRDRGFLSMECGFSMNIKGIAFKKLIYETLQCPKQWSKPDPETKQVHLTTDGKALLKILRSLKDQPNHLGIPIIQLAAQIAELRTREQMLHIFADPDGRIRCSYNIVGTSTGRISCSTSPTKSGYNLQTIPDNYESYPIGHPLRTGMRDLFLADPGYRLFQCDLKGSDGWTIGANLAALGDNNMLEDLRAGIKPASRICYMLRHGNGSLIRRPRVEVKELLKEIKKTDWDYFACKVGIWGICYLMGIDLLGEEITEESQGQLIKSRSEIEDFRNAVYVGYNVKLWHNDKQRRLKLNPVLIAPSGHKRKFFARYTDMLGQALAHEPQAVTTYATNLAAWKLWNDPENRSYMAGSSSRCNLRIQPLHQVHDALIGQFRIEDTTWAIGKIKSYFDNPITVAGINLTIPFEGNYGPNWDDLSAGTI